MAMSKDRLGDKMADAALAGLSPTPADEATFRATMKLQADEIIKEFIGFAELDSDGTTLSHDPGAAATIVDLPGVIKA